ncbi:hypothetical protein HDV02_002083 [Globomyces sp. JEL0801]|nr:hypothetical protein HDV02_002083 [Globomyces sp. JEL0801]
MKLLGSMKDGLKVYLNSNPKVKAIIIGTRKGDPFSEKMITQQPTDGDWPYVIRIHPILDWTYKDVWMAIRELNIPYCTLYDIGNTLPNPLLINPNTPSGYDPAYLLNDESAERNGRLLTLGEKFGKTSEDFQKLQNETIVRRDCNDRVLRPLEAIHKTLTKTTDAKDMKDATIYAGLATQMEHFADILPGDAPLNANAIKDGYMRNLRETIESHKEYAKLETKLENRRLEYDSKQNKMQKAKKENTVLEEETRVAQAKYDETMTIITEKMVDLNSKDVILQLILILERALNRIAGFCQARIELLYPLCRFIGKFTGFIRNVFSALHYLFIRSIPAPRPLSSFAPKERVRSSDSSLSRGSIGRPISYESETAPASIRSNSIGRGLPATVPRPVSTYPPPNANQKHVKALYEFVAESGNELTIRPGDIIIVTEEVDEGWWIGTIQGTNSSGMFPSNYTEVIVEPTVSRPRVPSFPKRESTYKENTVASEAATRTRSISHQPTTYGRNSTIGQPMVMPGMGQRSVSASASSSGCNDFSPHAFQAGKFGHMNYTILPIISVCNKCLLISESAPVHPKTTPEMLALIASAHEEREPETFTSAFWIKLLFAGVTLTAIYRYNEYYMQDKEVHPFTTYISTWAAHFDSRKTIESNLVGIPERLQAANDQLIFNSRPTFVNPVKRLSFPDTFSRASDFLIPVGSQIDVSDVQFKHTWQENDELLGVPNPRE